MKKSKKSKTPKVLIGAPIHEIKEYSIHQYITNTLRIDYPNFEVYLVDNSPKPDFYNYLRQSYPQITLGRLEFEPENYNNREAVFKRIVKSCNQIRDYFLSKEYDYLLSLECDVLIPLDGLRKLIDDQKDIVAGLSYPGFYPDEWWQSNEVREETRGTLGCALIKRNLLEQFKFRYDPNLLEVCHDAPFIHDIREKGYKFWVDCRVRCIHLGLDSMGFERGWGFLPVEELLE